DPLPGIRTELRLIADAGKTTIGSLITSLLAEAQHDLEVRAALVDRLFQPRRRAMAAAVRELQESGQIRSDADPRTIGDLLAGPLFYRMFVRHEPLTRRYADSVFDEVMAGLRPRTGKRGMRGR